MAIEPRDSGRAISIHALREEGDRITVKPPMRSIDFYPRPPRGGRHSLISACGRDFVISIHALREEGDNSRISLASYSTDFYPRPPRGGRLLRLGRVQDVDKFLSTPSARRATAILYNYLDIMHISIHALREEGDRPRKSSYALQSYFYPRPPRGGRLGRFVQLCRYRNISIHALREEGDLPMR